MLLLKWDPKTGIWCEDAESMDKLRGNYFGKEKDGKIMLDIEEALYLISFQNGVCSYDGNPVSFNELASHYAGNEQRLFIKFNAFRDWRDRGLILKRPEYVKPRGKTDKNLKKYPAKKLGIQKLEAKAYWYPDSLFSVLEDEFVGKKLFEDYWFGQWGIYKQERGSLLKLDFFETVFLAKHFGIKIFNAEAKKEEKPEKIMKDVTRKREYTKQLYEVYEDWRLRGYIVKTGFKFGSHFRIYFPGSSPVKEGHWVHSRHVLHVFPKEQKLLISEWARAVRVAHGVKKTFLLAIPELTKSDYIDYPFDYIAYRRKKAPGGLVRETPEDRPRYLFVAVSEDEHIGGIELASLLNISKEMGVELLLSITDRETSITYYVLKKVILPESDFEYYEIEWMKP